MDNRKWFKQARFGMMVHFGLYSLLAGEYRGRRTDFIGEWIQSALRIPAAEYEKLAAAFNPVGFDADEWIDLCIDAGMKYFVMTSKHHDGFALFRSKADPFNVVDASPFKRDIVGELAESCYKKGLKFGLYYSQAIDWHEKHGGGYDFLAHDNFGHSWCNDWDFPDAAEKNYSVCYEKKIRPQVEEILTQYGDLCLVWFDVPLSINRAQCDDLYDLVKKHQPDCLINSRLGNYDETDNCRYDYKSMGDNEIPEEGVGEDVLAETPATLNDTWGYKAFDQNWKDAAEVIRIKKHLNSRGINYLLNVGPDHLGRIPVPSADILREVGKRG